LIATTGRYSSPQQSEPPSCANATALLSQQNKNNPTITTTYDPKPANFPRSFKKKMLDNPSPTWYNGYIIIEMREKWRIKQSKLSMAEQRTRLLKVATGAIAPMPSVRARSSVVVMARISAKVMKGEQQMNKRFETGNMIQIGSRKENIALVLGPAWSAPATGGMWWVHRIESGKPIRIFQNASLIKVLA